MVWQMSINFSKVACKLNLNSRRSTMVNEELQPLNHEGGESHAYQEYTDDEYSEFHDDDYVEDDYSISREEFDELSNALQHVVNNMETPHQPTLMALAKLTIAQEAAQKEITALRKEVVANREAAASQQKETSKRQAAELAQLKQQLTKQADQQKFQISWPAIGGLVTILGLQIIGFVTVVQKIPSAQPAAEQDQKINSPQGQKNNSFRQRNR
jgi:hypothetical protein